MALIFRVLAVSLLTSALVTVLGLFLLQSAARHAGEMSEVILPVLFLACIGGLIGAIAGAAREIVAAQRPKIYDKADIN